MNISGVIVDPLPGRVHAVERALRRLPGVEVHAVSPQDRIVITLECASHREAVQAFESVRAMDGVLSAALVYAHTEQDPNRSISDEADAT
jgi:nitrate reductase NapD